MRIVIAHNIYQQRGGEETAFEAEVALLREHGHEVFTYTRDNAELNQIPARRAATETIWSREAAASIGSLIASKGAELVHFHNTFTRISPAAYYSAKANGATVVQTLHNYRLLCPVATFVRDGQRCEDCVGKAVPWPAVLHGCWRGSRLQTSVVASMLATHHFLGTWRRMVDQYITISEFSRQKFIKGGLPAEKISVKPNFVAPTVLPANHLGDYVLYAGRLSVEKGVMPLLEAWEHIDSVPLKIAGDGPLREQVLSAAARKPEQIEWVGQQTNQQVQHLMTQALLVVFPSLQPEGLGLAGLEALAVGVPVVAQRLGIMGEMIEDGKTGLLFEPNNAKDLARKIQWAFEHRLEMEKMRKACLATYEERWSPKRNYETLMAIYKKALQPST